jgi:hypothetical protein
MDFDALDAALGAHHMPAAAAPVTSTAAAPPAMAVTPAAIRRQSKQATFAAWDAMEL